MNFGRAFALLGISVCLGTVALMSTRAAQAEDHVTVRGQYYREPSTRVVQPVVELGKDLPNGVDVTAHFLLDAITSASAASGTATDSIFTEMRNEAGISVGKSWSRVRAGLAYRYSAESDYWSHMVVGSASFRLWEDTGTLFLSFGGGRDEVGRRVQGSTPMPSIAPGCTQTCALSTWIGGIWYSQILSPTILVQGGLEGALLDGFQSSPYRQVSGRGMENVPRMRLRNALALRAAKYFPDARFGLQVHYRYYQDFLGDDAWNIKSHTFEGRLFQRLGRDVEVRLTGRYYSQGAANFWCDLMTQGSCNTSSRYYANDPKLGASSTKFAEAKVFWDATRWRARPFLSWFSPGTFELSYGIYLQSTAFGNAHVLQTGYTLPF